MKAKFSKRAFPAEAPGQEAPEGGTENELETEDRPTGRRVRKTILNLAGALVVLAAVIALICTLWLPVYKIYDNGMAPVLSEGNYILTARQSAYQRGEIIVFNYYDKLLVKRVIAVGGDVVDIADDGTVTVNGAVLDEPYVTQKALGQCDIALPYTVPDGALFVMGDDRGSSVDSRAGMVGPVVTEQVVGRVVLRLWPLNKIGLVK